MQQLPLAPTISEALLHRAGPEGRVLQAVLDYERGQLDPDHEQDFGAVSLGSVFLSAIADADVATESILGS